MGKREEGRGKSEALRYRSPLFDDASRIPVRDFCVVPRRLESLKAWTQAKQVARDAYRASMDKPLCQHFRLADQIRGAANSVPANIIEGYALGTRPQLVRCLRIAFASACELSWHLEMAGDMELVPAERTRELQANNDTLIKLLVGLIKKLSQRE